MTVRDFALQTVGQLVDQIEILQPQLDRMIALRDAWLLIIQHDQGTA